MQVTAKAKGVAVARRKIRGMTPSETPTIVSRAMRESMEMLSVTTRAQYMSGPRGKSRIDEVSGNLKRSLQVDESRLPYSIRLGSDLDYAPIHEFSGGGKRSYLRRAYRALAGRIRIKFKESWEKAISELSE